MIIGVKHLIRCRKAAFLEYPDMHTTNRQNPFRKVGALFRIRLMKHTLIALSRGSGFVRINPWHYKNPVFHILGHFF